MTRTVVEVNVETGETITREWTPDELAAFQGVQTISPQEPTKAELLTQLAALTARVEALP